MKLFLMMITMMTSIECFGVDQFTVGLMLDKAGHDDYSFNASAYRGAKKAEKDLGIKLQSVEVQDAASAESMLRALASRKTDLLIAVGFSHASAVGKVAAVFPNKKFVIIDSEVKAPNVTSIMFSEHEGSFLVGAIAAMASKTNQVAFIGGMDIPLIRRFAMGYEAGVHYVNPKAKIQVAYIGLTGDAFSNAPKAKEIALMQHAQGADVIFHAAGASGLGLFDAAEEKKFLAIGCDSNQNDIKPGKILTSMVKSVDIGVFEAVKAAKAGTLAGGTTIYHGIANGGVDAAIDQNNKNLLTPAMLKSIKDIKAGISSGKIKVPDYYVTKK